MKTLQNTLRGMTMVAGALLSPGFAVAGADILTSVPPPQPRIEHEPPHRDGYVWAPGYWEWSGRFFHWVSGTWIPERPRAHWVADHWEQVGDHWHYLRGHWEQ